MSSSYIENLSNKKFVPNIVIFFMGNYYSSLQPDSGLVIDSDKVGLVKSLSVNPTTIDPSKASTTISSISFALLDKSGIISSLFAGRTDYLMNEQVLIYLGRNNVDMDFADYFLLPKVGVANAGKSDGSWSFSCEEKKDRIEKSAFSQATKLSGNILDATVLITVKDVTQLRTSGMVKIEKEFISYSGVDLVNNRLTGCVRGELDTIPIAHEIGKDVYQADEITAGPIEILLSLLISSGGGGTYDTLIDGAGIDENLIDIAQFLDVQESYFSETQLYLSLSGITSLKNFMETEILFPLGLRLRTNANSKIGLAVINRTYLDVDIPEFNSDNVTKNPNFMVSDNKVFNRIKVYWDYSEALNTFLDVYEVFDQDSIDLFGETVLSFNVKGPKADLDGLVLVEDIADQFLKRFSYPRPEISLSLQADAALALIGDKVDFSSTLVVDNETGLLALRTDLEMVSRAINYQTHDVTVKLSFTWYSGMRQCFISPTDKIVSVGSQKIATIAVGRGDLYRKTWVMRLWDDVAHEYASAQNNSISSISGDVVTFTDDWTIPLTTNHRFKFADYDEVVEQQKKYCYISNGSDFSDGKKQYQITA